jgi:hypothetical protein
MTASQVERWALEVLDRFTKSGAQEDDRVELKREPPEPAKLARRLAGHANAARLEPILWIFGVDETASTFVGVSGIEWSELWPQIASNFEGAATPKPIMTAIEWDGKPGFAVGFETDQPPYVVKSPAFGSSQGGPVGLEVPWRVGTQTKTATRTDLLLIVNYLNHGLRPWLKASAPFVDNSNGPNRTYQISVTNISSKPLRQCQAILRQIDRDGQRHGPVKTLY